MSNFGCIEDRVLQVANHFLENNTTIRETAEVFGISKSTIHKDLSLRLMILNNNLYNQVQKQLDYNFEQKHIRGGVSTKEKYLKTT